MDQTKRNILVVDDEWNIRNLIRFYLSKQPWMIEEASTGLKLLKKSNKNHTTLWS